MRTEIGALWGSQGPSRALIDTINGPKTGPDRPMRLDLNSMGDTLRTEIQLKPHESFKPDAVVVKRDGLVTDGSRTMILARPPAYTETGVPCIPGRELTKEQAQAHMDQWDTPSKKRAEALCSGCPVRDECLSAALEEEAQLDRWSRYLVRGGKVPSARADMVHGPRKVYLKPCEILCGWEGEKVGQHMRRAHPEVPRVTSCARPDCNKSREGRYHECATHRKEKVA